MIKGRKMTSVLLLLWAFLTAFAPPTKAAVRGDADSFVNVYDVMTDCLPDTKNTRDLKTGAAIFFYNETYPLALNDFLCHYELETASGYGFHVFIDEMYLQEDGTKPNQPCKDFVQFGRDRLFVTTSKSQEFCGLRSPWLQSVNGSISFTGGQGLRMYVEERDSEMDIWMKISRQQPLSFPSHRRRSLTMTVTVIKKDCGAKNPFYRQCSHTDHCIRREFFCDGRVNCAWPDAEAGGTDEVNCDAGEEPYRGPFTTKGAANIPLVIVMIVIGTVFLVMILVFGKKFVGILCKSSDLHRTHSGDEFQPSQTSSRPRRTTTTRDQETAAPAEVSSLTMHDDDEADNAASAPIPSAPPSYEDVIKDNPGVLSRGMPLAPPPYSESLTMTQV